MGEIGAPGRATLADVCAADAWVDAVAAGAPYPTPDALYAASDAAVRALDAAALAEALDGHAAIGRPRPDARSRREQARVTAAGDSARAAFDAANRAYRDRFGQVFLVCAAGRGPDELLAVLHDRLGNSPEAEREAVREELRRINRLRLRRVAVAAAGEDEDEGEDEDHGDPATARLLLDPPAPATVSTHVLDTAAGLPAPAVPVELAVRTGESDAWTVLGSAATDGDGRCRDLPALPARAAAARLRFDTAAHQRRAGEVFFPEAAVAFAVEPGRHYHVPLLLSPFGYSVYRGS